MQEADMSTQQTGDLGVAEANPDQLKETVISALHNDQHYYSGSIEQAIVECRAQSGFLVVFLKGADHESYIADETLHVSLGWKRLNCIAIRLDDDLADDENPTYAKAKSFRQIFPSIRKLPFLMALTPNGQPLASLEGSEVAKLALHVLQTTSTRFPFKVTSTENSAESILPASSNSQVAGPSSSLPTVHTPTSTGSSVQPHINASLPEVFNALGPQTGSSIETLASALMLVGHQSAHTAARSVTPLQHEGAAAAAGLPSISLGRSPVPARPLPLSPLLRANRGRSPPETSGGSQTGSEVSSRGPEAQPIEEGSQSLLSSNPAGAAAGSPASAKALSPNKNGKWHSEMPGEEGSTSVPIALPRQGWAQETVASQDQQEAAAPHILAPEPEMAAAAAQGHSHSPPHGAATQQQSGHTAGRTTGEGQRNSWADTGSNETGKMQQHCENPEKAAAAASAGISQGYAADSLAEIGLTNKAAEAVENGKGRAAPDSLPQDVTAGQRAASKLDTHEKAAQAQNVGSRQNESPASLGLDQSLRLDKEVPGSSWRRSEEAPAESQPQTTAFQRAQRIARAAEPQTAASLAIRLTNGSVLRAGFAAHSPLANVLQFIDKNRTDGCQPYILRTAYPYRYLIAGDKYKTLEELDLCPRSILVLQSSRAVADRPVSGVLSQIVSRLQSWITAILAVVMGFIFGIFRQDAGSPVARPLPEPSSRQLRPQLASKEADAYDATPFKGGTVYSGNPGARSAREENAKRDDRNLYSNGNSTEFKSDE